MSGKRWSHRYRQSAENFCVEAVADPFRPGQLVLTFSYKVEGTKVVHVEHVTSYVDLSHVVRLVEQARGVTDQQIARLQAQRSRLG